MKSLLLTFSIIISGLSLFAQDIEIYHEGHTVDISGTTVSGTGDMDEMKYYFSIKNNTNSALDLKIKRTRIIELAGTEDYFCWGVTFNSGSCYAASAVSASSPWISINEYTFPSQTVGILYSYHVPNGNYGNVKYRYYVTSNDVALDSIDVEYKHFLSVSADKKTSINVFPNPATDIINVNVENLQSAGSISIYDIAGKAVSEAVVKNGKNQLNVAALNAGVYFYTIRNNEGIIETKKLVIQ